MRLKIDNAGRVTIPKALRDRLGWDAACEVEMVETRDGITLRPVDRSPSLIRKGSFLVHTGEIPPGCDIVNAIDAERDERIRKAWGPVT